ncbi:response regulator [Cryobacterium sp. MLB-32]|uniref:response regulator transcription factor n=1 Tax=Cryobacterium sp. MLB-32 TaxID=1529318 RepID=UPI0004E616A3|nr:response regulator transcription factor [Cryobacterium sp. MLB-32]KFF60116.1 response regulator [Cryobacterium sp. MLB-32]
MPTEHSVLPRLLLIEDDPQLGPLIKQVLTEVYDVTLIADGPEGLHAGLTGGFEVMVIDRRLPGLDGLSVIETLRGKLITTPILLLTALGTTRDKVDGLDVGANDYLVKPFEFEELLARLRAVRRVFTGEGRSVAVGDWEYHPDSRTIYSPYDGRVLLTAKENELLRLLADSPQRTFSRLEILNAVFSVADTAGTVDTYVHYLRRKTDTDMVLTVRGHGYRLGQP